MNIVERAKNILIKPKDEWNVISGENTSVTQLITGYLLIMALIPAAAQFIRYGLVGYNIPFVGHMPGSISYGIRQAIVSYAGTVVGAYLSAFIIDILAPNFSSQKNFAKAMQLVVYSYTAAFVAGIFNLVPGLGILVVLGSLYGLYLLYVGLKPMMQTPEDKVTGYFVVSLLIIIGVSVLFSVVLGAIFLKSALAAAATGYPGM
jgi:hypothetical protein